MPKRFPTHDQVQALAMAPTPRPSESWPTPGCTGARRWIIEVHGRVVVGITKTHQRRSVPIPCFLADELANIIGKAPGDLLFTAHAGGVLRNTNFRPRFFDPDAEKPGSLV
jgi:hypothetical protein